MGVYFTLEKVLVDQKFFALLNLGRPEVLGLGGGGGWWCNAIS